MQINEFLNSEYLNLNKKLLTLLHLIQSNHRLSAILEPQDQIILTSFLDFLTQQQRLGHEALQQQNAILNYSRLFQQNIARVLQKGFPFTLTREDALSLPQSAYFN